MIAIVQNTKKQEIILGKRTLFLPVVLYYAVSVLGGIVSNKLLSG